MSGFHQIKLARLFIDQNGVGEVGQSAALLILLVALEQDRLYGKAVCWPINIAMGRLSLASRDRKSVV